MLRLRVFLLVVLMVGLVCSAASALSGPGITPEDVGKLMPVSEVRAGMKGYGLTVFRGTKIERFNVEVLGVLKKANAGGDLILVKMSGGPITERGANIIQGMSGSPVYVNGRLIGAVAYGSAFPKEPIGMLTPIEDMIEALDPSLPPRPSGYSSEAVALAEPINVGGQSIRSIRFTPTAEGSPVYPGTANMVPLSTPLMVSGMSARGIEMVRELLGPYNLMAMAGPGASGIRAQADLVPGAAVGVALATGDVELIGIGTLTYRRGSKVVAFGHPMLGIGAIDAPMTTAYVHDIIPGVMFSSKIASPLAIKGRIFQDRPWSIGGEVGKMASMIPVKITIDDRMFKRQKTLNINVVNHPLLAARLITLVAGEGIYNVHGTPGDATASVRMEVNADKIGIIRRENMVFDSVSIDSAAVEDLRRLLSLLSGNRFYPIDIKSVELSVTITGTRKTAVLEGAFVEKSKYEPGETIDIGLVLRPYKQDRVTQHIQMTIPAYAPNGRYTLQITGGRGAGPQVVAAPSGEAAKEGVVLISSGGPDASAADNISQLVKKFLEQEKNNEIAAKLLFPTSAVVLAGEKLTRLPAPLASVIKSTRTAGLKSEREEVKVSVPTDYVISGAQTLQITVERPNQADKKGAQPADGGATDDSSGADSTSQSSGDDSSSLGVYDELMRDAVANIAAASPWTTPFSARTELPNIGSKSKSGAEADDERTDAESDDATKADTKKPEKPVARQPSTWRQDTYADFSGGTFEGATATTKDEVRLAPRLRRLANVDQSFIWSLASDGSGGVYAGTGPDGQILRVSSDGTMSVLYDSDQLGVHALLSDPSGAIYAGTSPNGIVYKVDSDGKVQIMFDASEKHVVALARDSKGGIYAGMGDGGAIYHISGAQPRLLAVLPDPELVALTVDSADNLYAGTGPSGVVYKVTPVGEISSVYDAAEQYAAALAVDQAGNLYVGTAPKGVVYKIPSSGAPKAVIEKSPGPITALLSTTAGIYVATEGQVYLIDADDRVSLVDTGRSRVQFTALANSSSGALYAGTANPAAVYVAEARSTSGTYESAVHDAKLTARWGTISWSAETPEGTSVTLQTRSGNSSTPDNTWSGWSAEYTRPDGESVKSPPGRFIQYRARLSGGPESGPVLKSVSLVYLPQNQAPKVTISSPKAGARWSGKQTVRWVGTDPDKDTLTYDVYYSADNGATWKALRRGVQTKDAKGEPKNEAKTAGEEKPSEPAKTGSKDSSEPNEEKADGNESKPSKDTSYVWDTSRVSDGSYLLKVVVSDRISNGDGYLTAEKVSEPFIIANKPPRLVLFKRSLAIHADRSVVLSGYAYHDVAEIAGVQYRVDDGEWMAASADDGIYDSTTEAFTIRTGPLDKGERAIEIKAIDAAGNAATAKEKAKVE